MPKDSGNKRQKIQPEEALRLQEEIEEYLSWMRIKESIEDSGPPLSFERRLINALEDRARAEEFFEKMVAFCRTGTNQWHWLESAESQIRWLAVQSRIWLERNGKPVTRDAIRRLVRMVWAAHLVGYQPDQSWEEHRKGDLFEWTVERTAGHWSEFDYMTSVQLAIERDSNFAADLERRVAREFPNDVWKRVWRDTRLCDIKPEYGTSPDL